MKYILSIFLICIFLFACATNPTPPPTTHQPEALTVKYLQTSAYLSGAKMMTDMPVYSYVGEKDFSDEKVFRRYNVWENKSENKHIMIYHIIVKDGKFPNNIQWIDRDSAILVDGNRAVYTEIAGRAWATLEHFNIEVSGCFMLAQAIHVNEKNNEAILRILITPDEDCSQQFWNPINELDRVTTTNPLR